MERIEALINKLKQQAEQQADPSVLLGTVQLLQFELTKLTSSSSQGLGTAKVAVVLPAVPTSSKFQDEMAKYSAYVPKAVEAMPENNFKENREVKETKETVLVENGSVSLVQKNGQLDMVFDPMKEIPTLAHQTKRSEINDHAPQQEKSLNDKLNQSAPELMHVLKESPIKDLRKAIGINDRFLFINELFRGDESTYERSIKTINNFAIYAEAEYWISRELKVKLGWDDSQISVQHFDQLVKRRFS